MIVLIFAVFLRDVTPHAYVNFILFLVWYLISFMCIQMLNTYQVIQIKITKFYLNVDPEVEHGQGGGRDDVHYNQVHPRDIDARK